MDWVELQQSCQPIRLAFVKTLQRLVEDDALRYKVTKEGQRCAREDFSLDRYVIELEDFLQRTIGRTK